MKTLFDDYLKGDRVIWAVIMILFIISMLAVYSSSGTLAYKYQGGNTLYYFMKHTFFLVVGVAIIIVFHKIPYKYYSGLSQILVGISVILLLFTLALGVTRNAASRWLTLPGIGIDFQTSDIAKLALIMFVSRILSLYQNDKEGLKNSFKPIIMAVGIVCGLILPANFSTAGLLFGTIFILMIIGRIDTMRLLATVGVIVVAFLLFLLIASHFPEKSRVATWYHRIESFVSGDSDENFQAEQAKIAIVTGGITGKLPGNSVQRNFLPHPYSDFIYAIIVEEYGIIGGIVVLSLYLFLLWRAGYIVSKLSRTFPAFLVLGLTLIMVFQALMNMAVAVNLLPVTGQPLPFVSMGGTSILFTSIAFGIILSVSRSIEEQEMNEELVNENYIKAQTSS
jgi:cell division protein FtsW